MKDRSRYVSIIKGIGIVEVVLGHTYATNIVLLIYYWHLPLLFFDKRIMPKNAIKYDMPSGFDAFWNLFKLMLEPLAGPLWFM